ncbi:MAG: hypothetical protein HY397_03330 [Candidatus Doudnabacteria bacterium]|nr:hypothetical protein [Candidatus Doudnabacteria bacterium]
MSQELLAPYLFILSGVALILLSFPGINQLIIGPLQQRGYLPLIKPKRKRELILGAGPRLSMLLLGTFLIAAGLLLLTLRA